MILCKAAWDVCGRPAAEGGKQQQKWDGVPCFFSRSVFCCFLIIDEQSTEVWLFLCQAYIKEALPESMVARLYDGMKSVQLPEKSPGPRDQVAKEQFVIFMSALLKGTAEEKSRTLMRMIAGSDENLKGSHMLKVKENNFSLGLLDV